MKTELLKKLGRINTIPAGWKLTTVGKVCKIRNDLRKPLSTEERAKIQGAYPYYGPTGVLDFIDHHLVEGQFALIGEDGDHFLKPEQKAQTLLVNGKFNVNNHAHLIQGTEKCSSEWFFLYFHHRDITHLISRQGASRYKLNKDTLSKLPILVPPLNEQLEIYKLFTTWDNAIEKTEALIAAKEKQFEWLCQTYFKPGNSTNSGWEKHKIASFVTVRNEREVPSEEVPLYSLTIENGVTAKTDRYNREFLVIDKGGKKYKVVHPKDIVFNPANLRWGAIARSEVEHKVVLSPIYEVLKVDENKIDSDFLTHALTCSRQIAIFATMVEGTLVERMAVKIDTFLSCHIHVPSSKEEQKNIAHVLNLSKQEISLLKKTLEQYRSQKRGLMQKLLTGEWQVGSSQHLSEETCQELSREGVA
ncbi:restriction endonuclease subunit S [Vibrio parahaemolyticus]|nr:restriction endonuclease subunit S [Vibrio parahaemolyticus]MDF5101630.1 restriction endonuclease subunit S [Vibrio parahaemolyticus]